MKNDNKLHKIITNVVRNVLNEQYYNIKDETQWMWVSPDNNIIKVPKLNHKNYIMQQYKNTDFGWDYDKVFNKAIEDGWVRVIYEKSPNQYKGELSINGYDKNRVKYVLKNVFADLIRFGNKTIYIDYENPKESNVFSTFSPESKSKLIEFLSESANTKTTITNGTLNENKSGYLKLQRGQTGSVTEPWDLNYGVGQHGEGIYAFFYGDNQMKNYYTKRGENLHTFQIPMKYVADLSNKNLDFWEAKTFIFNNPQYKAFIFKHNGHGIPSSKEVLIIDPEIIEIL